MKKNSVNTFTGDVGMSLSHLALKSQNSREKFPFRMMYALFNGNFGTTIVSCDSNTKANNKTDIITFYNEISSLVRHILEHNVLTIGRDMNAQTCKDINIKF